MPVLLTIERRPAARKWAPCFVGTAAGVREINDLWDRNAAREPADLPRRERGSNPLDKAAGMVLSDNNRRVLRATAYPSGFIRAVRGRNLGSYYYELESGGENTLLGLATAAEGGRLELSGSGSVGSQGYGGIPDRTAWTYPGPGHHLAGARLSFCGEPHHPPALDSQQRFGLVRRRRSNAQTGGYDVSL
jgi:hypothetical protein